MIIKNAEFIKSSASVKQCPESKIPEFAFIGRSNVGKSSLINYLAGKKNMAKTSSTPGKTRLVNHYLINDQWYIVDLPGYGFARTGKQEKKKINTLIYDYIGKRMQMYCLFVLIDCRHKAQSMDMQFIRQLGENQVPFVLVFTKTDKLSHNELQNSVNDFKRELQKTWEEIPQYFFTSVKNKSGREELLDYIGNCISPGF